MTYTRPLRRTTLQFSQIRLTLARTFIAACSQNSVYRKPDSIGISPALPQGPFSGKWPFLIDRQGQIDVIRSWLAQMLAIAGRSRCLGLPKSAPRKRRVDPFLAE